MSGSSTALREMTHLVTQALKIADVERELLIAAHLTHVLSILAHAQSGSKG